VINNLLSSMIENIWICLCVVVVHLTLLYLDAGTGCEDFEPLRLALPASTCASVKARVEHTLSSAWKLQIPAASVPILRLVETMELSRAEHEPSCTVQISYKFVLARSADWADVEMNPGPINQLTVSPTNMQITESDVTSITEEVAAWLFPSTAGSFAEQMVQHSPGNAFNAARIREVSSFSMADAESHFVDMTADAAIRQTVVNLGNGVLDLKAKTTKHQLGKLMPTGKGVRYIMVRAIMIAYRPLTNAFGQGSKIEVTLSDSGLTSDNPALVSLSKTLPANILLGTNYSIGVKDAKDLSLTISVGATGVTKGRPWGTAEIKVLIETSPKPFSSGATKSFVQYLLPSDIFEVASNDPTKFNAVLVQADIDRLRDIKDDIPGARNLSLETTGIFQSMKNRPAEPAGPASIGSYLRDDPFSLRGDPDSSTESSRASSVRRKKLKSTTVVTPIDQPSPEQLAVAASMMRKHGFHVSRSISVEGDEEPELCTTTADVPFGGHPKGILGVLSVEEINLPREWKGSVEDVPSEYAHFLHDHAAMMVHVLVDEEDERKNLVRREPFEGSSPIQLGSLCRFMPSITFN